jgi:hypothetical protein
MKEKLADTLDRHGTPTNIGDYVFFNGHRGTYPRLMKTLGKLNRIDGAYHYIIDVRNKACQWELYSIEFEKATPEQATLWMFENF